MKTSASCPHSLAPAPFKKGVRPHTAADLQDAGTPSPGSPWSEVLVYLDVDGVLNTVAHRKSRRNLVPELIKNLGLIFEAVPAAAIMLSTAWRLQPALVQELEKQLLASGIAPPIGSTGELPLHGRYCPFDSSEEAQLARLAAQRSAEILCSIAARRPLAWIAIDDLDLRRKLPSRAGARPKSRGGLVGASLPTSTLLRLNLPQLPSQPLRQGSCSMGLDSRNFVHTSEAEGLTVERAECAVNLLRKQLSEAKLLASLHTPRAR
mmetsp:Transcript_86543/g.242365  ORF Transcript_86543/g.242365 Transcript_86543/m.242365 type:complete len:264 (-) Transcript_86543:153-944(-)